MGFPPHGFPPGMPPPPGMNFMVPPPGLAPMMPMVPMKEESEYRRDLRRRRSRSRSRSRERSRRRRRSRSRDRRSRSRDRHRRSRSRSRDSVRVVNFLRLFSLSPLGTPRSNFNCSLKIYLIFNLAVLV